MSQPEAPVRWSRVALLLLVLAGLSGAGWYAYARAKPDSENTKKTQPSDHKTATNQIAVDVVKPQAGPIQRLSNQPGSVEPFEGTELYAKASGYLISQTLERDGKPVLKDGKPVEVDIGVPVQAGDVLAKIWVPEYEKTVEHDKAQVKDAQAKVKQMDAHLVAAQAEWRAAQASVNLAEVMVKAKTAFRHYREKQLDRIKGLYAQNAVDAKLVDEQEDYFLSAQEAENAAKEHVITAQEQANAAKAKIEQAKADLDEANAYVGVCQALLEKSEVLLSYTIIQSPYTGVVTRRSYFPGQNGRTGAFIKSADQGGITPLFVVERTDLMRVIVQVPDRDVPFLYIGAPAVVRIDALAQIGIVYRSDAVRKIAVSRWARAEDPITRTMRTEIDIPNPDGMLQAGMYGRVAIDLSDVKAKGLRIPSNALVGKADNGVGKVRIVQNGKVHIATVKYATDNGVEVEVTEGLSPNDDVIVRASAVVEEGTPVNVNAPMPAKGGGH